MLPHFPTSMLLLRVNTDRWWEVRRALEGIIIILIG